MVMGANECRAVFKSGSRIGRGSEEGYRGGGEEEGE